MYREANQRLQSTPGYQPAIVFSIYCSLYASFLITACTVLTCCIALAIPDKHKRTQVLHKIQVRCVQHLLSMNKGWQICFEGLEKLGSREQFVVVANHQSLLDPFLLYALPLTFKWVVKKWVFRVPLLGLALRVGGHIAAAPRETLPACREELRSGLSIIIFAEGTRSPDGSLQSFKMGAFRIAAASGVRILPIVIDGTRQILPKYHKILGRKAVVNIRILDPVCPTDFGSNPERLRTEIRNVMAKELNQMRGLEHVGAAISRCP